jgi:hypothetical protein
MMSKYKQIEPKVSFELKGRLMHHRSPIAQVLSLVGFSALLLMSTACSRVHVTVKKPEMNKFEELEAYAQNADSTEGKQDASQQHIHQDEPWWHSLNDPQLNTLVDGLFANNLQLKQATERITQMRAIVV